MPDLYTEDSIASIERAMELRVVPYDESWLKLSHEWLHDEEMLELMRTTPFTADEQERWFANLGTRNDYKIWGVEAGSVKIGAFGFRNILADRCEYWGYIGDKRYWGRGAGRWMLYYGLKEARSLQLRSIYLKVVAANTRAVHLYQNFGFAITRSDNDLYWMERTL